MAAIVLPVIIHLWNVRTGKTVKVGSIALLRASARQRARSWRIHNWPLLLLRCLLLVLISILLAHPLWRKTPKAGHAGWILVPAAQLRTAYAHYGPQIDSLLKAGLELHQLAAGFEPLALADTAASSPARDSTVIATWALLSVLNEQLPPSFPVHVFINNRLSQFQGNRPLTHLAIHWNSFDAGDRLQSHVQTYITADGQVKDLSLISTPEGNYYEAGNNASAVPTADTTAIQVAIYPGRNTADARYVKAAVDAIGQYSNRRIHTQWIPPGDHPMPTGQHLVFWLDDQKPPVDLLPSLSSRGILFQYDTGAVVNTASWLSSDYQPFRADLNSKLYRYAAGDGEGKPLYTLANGRPLLTAEEKDGKRILHFKSRFNPQWSDMVWEENFVKFLLPWVMPEQGLATTADIRRVDNEQVVPQQIAAANTTNTNRAEGLKGNDLSPVLWILAFICFIAERLLAHRQKQVVQNA